MKFDNLENIRITSSESKVKLGISGKVLMTSLGLKTKIRSKKIKKEKYAIENDSKKDLSKIIKEFEKLSYESYEKQRPKHEPTDSYFYLSRQLALCMMRSDTLNLHVHPVKS